jgi:D-sedoheptulose 7-phosphate isomerase
MNSIEAMAERHPELQSCVNDIRAAFEVLLSCFQGGNKLLLCGNGGSCSDCEHIAGELVKSFSRERPLDPGLAEKLGPELATNLHGSLPAIPLPSFTAFHTAFANDDHPEYAFAQQVIGLGKPGDVLLAISTSGNSANVLHAAKTAQATGLKTIALTGQGGSPLAALCEVVIQAPGANVARIQEFHLPIYHALCQELEDSLFG